jgi:pantetheine-phosphate adenylyltransferase
VTTALCAGSFDPVTNGHLDVIGRASALFDRVVVAVVVNPSKAGRLPVDTRVDLVRRSCEELVAAARTAGHLVEVRAAQGLVVDLAREVGADTLVKGVRNGADIDTEMTYAAMNRELTGGGRDAVDTVWLPAAPRYSFASSSLVWEIAGLGGDVAPFVPAPVLAALRARFPSSARPDDQQPTTSEDTPT